LSIFLYIKKESPIHSLDPRVKIAGLLCAFLAAALAADLPSIAALVVLFLAFFLAAGCMDNLFKMSWLFLLVTGMTFLLWYAFYAPAGRTQDSGRAVYAGVMSLRFLGMLMAGLLFLSVTALEDFTNGLMLMRVPYAVAFAISLSFRLVNTFIGTGFMIIEAQRVRGNDAGRGNIIKRILAYAPLVAPLVLNGIKKAETLNLALESKGFSPKNRIDISGRYVMTRADAAVLLSLGVITVVMIAYRFLLK
jgi:energy-coupling factor transport system permease protein